MKYVITEYDKIREEFPEFDSVMVQLETDLIAKAKKDWTGAYGGMYPRADQFGKGTIMPQLFRDISNTTMTTWDQWLTGTGHQTIMSGANGGNIYEDYKIGICGLAFLDKSIRIAEIRMQISDKKLPRINVEEAMAYEKPAIVFEEAFLLDEKTGFDLYAYVLCQGPQRIKLIGLEVNRVPNKLQTTNTGAPLT
jgi:hypothetical protein